LYSLVQNHPFIDGNKRVGHGAAELLLRENQQTIRASDDELESLILSVASSRISLESLVAWMQNHVTDLPVTDD
jgi:death on curing protein